MKLLANKLGYYYGCRSYILYLEYNIMDTSDFIWRYYF
jgi:hypothetical protein